MLAFPALLQAQSDTTALNRIVVTADRAASTLGSSTMAVTRIEATEVAHIPHATVADILRLVPGMVVVDFDGSGRDPQIMTRGFYGGGEAEYVVVMVDGIPVDQLHTGLIPWDGLPPLSAIEAVEVVRGGNSPLYGSGAIGAVVNIITRRGRDARLSVSGGTFGSWRLDGSLRGFSAALDRTDGYRDHAQRTVARAHTRVRLGDLMLSAASHWREFEEPGALHEDLLAQSRKRSDPLFRFDDTQDRAHSLGISFTRGPWRAWGSADVRHTDAVRTILLAPDFGDTKERVTDTRRASGSLQFEQFGFTAGIDASYGTLASEYFAFSNGGRGALDASGDGDRAAAAVFAQYALQPLAGLRITLSARGDWIADSFDGRSVSQSAVSPRIGANLRLTEGAYVYATASRSFKAPTLDQLFDQRTIPIPFPPFSATTSNGQLKPQYGTNVEAGLYYAADYLTASVSLYQMDMKDELDFDVQTLRYINIGRSRHRGVEMGARYDPQPGVSFFVSDTRHFAEARSGENAGKYLKAIPRRVLSSGFTVQPLARFDLGGQLVQHERMFLDDANTRQIFGYSRLDVQFGYRISYDVRLTLELRNAFRNRYESSGFPDPAGGDAAFFYPAAPQSLQLGLRYGW